MRFGAWTFFPRKKAVPDAQSSQINPPTTPSSMIAGEGCCMIINVPVFTEETLKSET